MALMDLIEGRPVRLLRDDDGHDYIVPVEMAPQFEAWLAWHYEPGWDYVGPDFNLYRLGLHPSRYVFRVVCELP